MLPKPLALATGLLLATHLPLSAAVPPESPATPLAASFPFCAWWTETTASSLNVAFPDASAAYWTTPFLASPDLVSITINGTYENARYFSINAYNSDAASYTCGSANAPSALADYLIAPDSGSQNPFQTNAAPGGNYTVTVGQPSAGVSTPNTIPFYRYPGCQPAPSQGALPSALGFLILRAYLPHDGFDKVALPNLTLRYTGGRSVTLPQCRAVATTQATAEAVPRWARVLQQLLVAGDLAGLKAPGVQPCGRSGAPACPPALTFFRPPDSATGGFFPNVDNKYVAALVQPKPGTVVVIRAQAAGFPPGMQAAPWDPKATQLRYWSMCSNIYRRPWPVVVVNDDGQDILGCAPDLATVLDSQGFYTYVVSHLADKPSDAVLAANSATWLPFSNTQPFARHLMILRNMLGADFPHSVQNCAAGSDPGSIAACKASMGAYYPEVAECRARTFERGGAAACFQESQLIGPSAAGTLGDDLGSWGEGQGIMNR
jgi:hypothetical protein